VSHFRSNASQFPPYADAADESRYQQFAAEQPEEGGDDTLR
jgi:hypothetical protein